MAAAKTEVWQPEKVRPLYEIAREIRRDPAYASAKWCAEPYRSAMADMEKISDQYGHDSAKSIVSYFLSNVSTWRGETARNIKKELNWMLKHPNA